MQIVSMDSLKNENLHLEYNNSVCKFLKRAKMLFLLNTPTELYFIITSLKHNGNAPCQTGEKSFKKLNVLISVSFIVLNS